jgi:hypothetical protein
LERVEIGEAMRLLAIDAAAMFVTAASGRLLRQNDPEHSSAPAMFFAGCAAGNIFVLRADVSAPVAQQIEALVAREPPFAELGAIPLFIDRYRELLARDAPVPARAFAQIHRLPRAHRFDHHATIVKQGSAEGDKLFAELKRHGLPFAVWSKPMTLSSHERSAYAQFMKDWFGKALSKEEWDRFDTEDLIGRPAEVVIIHEHVNGETYANIKLIMPDKSGNPMKLSGKFVRAKNRPPKDGAGAGQQGGYRRAAQPASDDGDLGATKIHVGRCKGLEVRDLAPEQVQALIENWLPTAKANAKPTADDKRLIAALDWWQSTQKPAADDDNVPY